MDPGEYIFKIVLVGNSGVGKTSLLYQFTHQRSLDKIVPTIGVDYGTRNLTLKENQIKLQIWDTAGQEKYRTFVNSYYRNASLAVVVYDITKLDSFHDVEKWILDIRESIAVPLMIIGNKQDLEEERQVPFRDGKLLSQRFNGFFFETSALSKTSTAEAFDFLASQLVKFSDEGVLANDYSRKPCGPIIKLDKQEKSRKCCFN